VVISKTPLRVSLLGGGTDFRDYYAKSFGIVISMSINKYIHVIVKERFDNLIVLNYSKRETVECVGDIQHRIIRECLVKSGIDRSIEITTLADIPSTGSGLGSSSVVTVGLLNALYAFQGLSKNSAELAQDACDIEINILGSPIGKQDQYIAAFGGLSKIKFNPDETVEVTKYPFSKFDQEELSKFLILNFTEITRSANNILKEQTDNTARNREDLDQLKGLAMSCDQSLMSKEYENIGKFLALNWSLKKRFSTGVSNDTIDSIVDLAVRSGSSGSKISGAGGGGFLLSFVPAEHRARFRAAMSRYRELPFGIDNNGTRVVYNGL
jgi:D-glycero-alpha-D-manno-heptose-7-phosphate kinase